MARGQGIKEVLTALFILLGDLVDRVVLGENLAPFLVQLEELLEIFRKTIDRLVVVLFNRWIKLDIERGLRGISGGCLGLGPSFPGLGIDLQGSDLFQNRVQLELLLHHRLELQHGCLQKRQRMLELRRQHHLLGKPLAELKSRGHRAARYRKNLANQRKNRNHGPKIYFQRQKSRAGPAILPLTI